MHTPQLYKYFVHAKHVAVAHNTKKIHFSPLHCVGLYYYQTLLPEDLHFIEVAGSVNANIPINNSRVHKSSKNKAYVLYQQEAQTKIKQPIVVFLSC